MGNLLDALKDLEEMTQENTKLIKKTKKLLRCPFYVKNKQIEKDIHMNIAKSVYGNKALIAVQHLIRALINDPNDPINLMDGNADNYIELSDYLKRNPTLDKNSELYILIKTAIKLLKYGS